MADLKFSLRLTAEDGGFSGTVSVAAAEVEKLGKKTRDAAAGADALGGASKKAGSDVKSFADAFKQAQDKSDSLAVSLAKQAAGYASMTYVAYKAAEALKDTVVALFEATVRADKLNATFMAVTGSTTATAKALAFVRETSNRLGIDTISAANAFAKLTASAQGTALQGAATRQIFESVAEASARLGLSTAETDGALLAISQMMSKGVVSAEELRGQLGERLPGAFNIAARAMGVTTAELGEMLQKGEILAEDFLPKFAAALKEAYGGDAMHTAQSELARLGNAWEEFKQAVASSGFGDLARKALEELTNEVKAASTRLNEWKRLGELSGDEWVAGFIGKAGMVMGQLGGIPGRVGEVALRGIGQRMESGEKRYQAAMPEGVDYDESTRGVQEWAAAVQAALAPGKAYMDLMGKMSGVSKEFSGSLQVLYEEFVRQGGASNPENLKRYRAEVEALIKAETDIGKEWDKNLKKKDDGTKAFKAMADAINRAYEDALNWAKAEQELEEIEKKRVDGLIALAAEEGKRLMAMAEGTRAYEQQTDAIGKTKEEVLLLQIARAEERLAILRATEGSELYVEQLEREIDAMKRRLGVERGQTAREQAKAAQDEWQRAADGITNSLTDALLRGFESGKDFAQNLVDTMKNLFNTLVLRPIIQAIVSPVAGAVTGALGLGGASGTANAASGLGGIGNLLGGGGGGGTSLLGMGGISGLFSGSGGIFGAGAIGNSFAMGSAGQALGLSAVGLDAAGGVALTGLGTALGTIIPIVGAGLAIAAMFGAFSKKGGPKSGGFASTGATPGISGTDSSGRWFTPNQSDSSMKSVTDSLSADFKRLVTAFGGTATAGFAMGFDTDPQGTAPNRVHAGAFVGGKQVYNAALGNLGRDEATLKAALETESKRALLAALQASDLPESMSKVLNFLDAATASGEAIDALLSLAQVLGGDLWEDAKRNFAEASRSTAEKLRDMGQEVRRLATESDGSAESLSALSTATGAYRQAVAATLAAIKEIGAAMSKMFADTREQIEFGGLDKQAEYNLYQKKGQDLLGVLEQTDDPAKVQEYATKINDYFLKAWNLLSPEEMQAERPRFMESLDKLDAAVAEKLDSLGAAIGGEATDTFTAVQEALADAATKMGQAADGQVAAAAAMGAAAERLANTTITVNVDNPAAVGGLG